MSKKIHITTGIVLIFLFVFNILDAYAITLGEYEAQVNKYTKEINDKNSEIAKNNAQIQDIADDIANIQVKINNTTQEIKTLQEEIDASNKKIEEKKEESKKIIEYYQVSSGNNAYLEYVFGAEDITDMIYRASIVEQLTEYNEKLMNELQALIEENKKKTIELNQKKQELVKLKAELENKKAELEKKNKSIAETIPNVKEELKVAQSMVTKYKNLGCSSNDVIGVDCAVPPKVVKKTTYSGASDIIGANGFRNPVPGARVSWAYGSGGHKGIDYVKGYGAPIYAVAAGQVYYVGNGLDIYGAKMVIIVHNVNGRLVFSQYAHLSGYNCSVGDVVSTGSVIGYMGSSGYSTGPHLHLEMSEDYGWAYNSSYYQYINHIINPLKYIPG